MIEKIRAVYERLKNQYPNTSNNFAIMKLYVSDPELRQAYHDRAAEHNYHMMNNPFPDSGFDLLVPDTFVFDGILTTKFMDLQFKAEMLYCNVDTDKFTASPFYIYPRSSMSKTPLMLANHTGIVDSGYRGNLIAAFRCLFINRQEPFVVEKHTRLVQICHPSLCPVFILFADKEDDLSTTQRGDGGFGSTG